MNSVEDIFDVDVTESVKIEKRNGEIVGPYKIMFLDPIMLEIEADIEKADRIARVLPNGKCERHLVNEAIFHKAGEDSFCEVIATKE